MTYEEFIKTAEKEIKGMTQNEIEMYYNFSVKLFNSCFDKWKKEIVSTKK